MNVVWRTFLLWLSGSSSESLSDSSGEAKPQVKKSSLKFSYHVGIERLLVISSSSCRPDIENCNDAPHLTLVDEVGTIHQNIERLNQVRYIYIHTRKFSKTLSVNVLYIKVKEYCGIFWTGGISKSALYFINLLSEEEWTVFLLS